MGLKIQTFPVLPSSIQTVTLEGQQYRLRLTWRHRLQAWYLDLYQLDETPLLLGRRLSPQWSPNAGPVVEGAPTGFFYVRGSDGYAREDLGQGLELVYYTAAEIAAVAGAASSDLTVQL